MPRKKKLPRVPICPTCLYLTTHCTCGPADRIKLDSPEAFQKAMKLNIPARQVGKTEAWKHVGIGAKVKHKDIKDKDIREIQDIEHMHLAVTRCGPDILLKIEEAENRLLPHLENNLPSVTEAMNESNEENKKALQALADDDELYPGEMVFPLTPKMKAMLMTQPEFEAARAISDSKPTILSEEDSKDFNKVMKTLKKDIKE